MTDREAPGFTPTRGFGRFAHGQSPSARAQPQPGSGDKRAWPAAAQATVTPNAKRTADARPAAPNAAATIWYPKAKAKAPGQSSSAIELLRQRYNILNKEVASLREANATLAQPVLLVPDSANEVCVCP